MRVYDKVISESHGTTGKPQVREIGIILETREEMKEVIKAFKNQTKRLQTAREALKKFLTL